MTVALSLCMVVKNEERNLPCSLNSVRRLAGETILVDTGSTNRTPRIAAEYGARVVPFDFTRVDFAAARNCAIDRARGRWILMLDADEALGAAAEGIAALIARDENAGYYLERCNHASDAPDPTTDYVVRLFPNRPSYRYRGSVHETIDAAILAGGGRLLKAAGVAIEHDFVSDRETRRRKNRWYIEILKEVIEADPADDSRLDFLAAEYHELGMFDAATEVAKRIVRARPCAARAHLFLGTCYLGLPGELDGRARRIRRSAEAAPGLSRSRVVSAPGRGARARESSPLSTERRAAWHNGGMSKVMAFAAVACALLAQGGARAADNELTPQEKAAGWRLLFDGKTFANWVNPAEKTPPGDSFTIEDGCLKATRRPRITEDLFTKEVFRSFELAFDWKIAPGGNSGIKYRIQDHVFIDPAKNLGDQVNASLKNRLTARPDRGQDYVIGFEYQLLDNERNGDGRVPNDRTGALYGVFAPLRDATRPVGEFNNSRLVVRGAHIEHWLNGAKVVDGRLDSPDVARSMVARWGEGTPACDLLVKQPRKACPISLQNHDTEAWFRNIKIRALR